MRLVCFAASLVVFLTRAALADPAAGVGRSARDADWRGYLSQFDQRSGELTARERELEKALNELRRRYGPADSAARPDGSLTVNFTERDSAYRDFQSRLDQLIQDELDETARLVSEYASHRVRVSGDSETAAKLQKIQDHLQAFTDSKPLYGTGKDYKRFAAFFKVMSEAQVSAGGADSSGASVLLKMRKLAQRIALLAPMADCGANALFQIFRRETGPGETSFNNAVEGFYRRWAKASGLKVQIENHEILESKPADGRRVIRVIAPVHRDGDLDEVAISSLGLKNKIIFGALNLEKHPIFGMTGNPLAKSAVESLKQHDNFILLGDKESKEGPLDKMVRLLKAGKSDNVVIFPEGQVSLGLMETRPVRERFSDGLLEKLEEEGFDYEVVPITLENSGQLLHYDFGFDRLRTFDGSDTLKVRVHPPITKASVAEIKKRQGDPSALNRLLRQIWLESMPSDSDVLMGQSRFDFTVDGLSRFLSTNELKTQEHRAALIYSTGDELRARIDSIRAAKREIVISSFRIQSSPEAHAILAELEAKAREGVRVRLLIDGVGLGRRTPHLQRDVILALQNAGVEIKTFESPSLLGKFSRVTGLGGVAGEKLHSKIQLVDETALIGSTNLTRSALNLKGSASLETNALIQGPAVDSARAYLEQLWSSPMMKKLEPVSGADSRKGEEILSSAREWIREIGIVDPEKPADLTSMLRPVREIRLFHDPVQTRSGLSEVSAEVNAAISRARESVVISTPKANISAPMRASLESAKANSVPVKIVTNSWESSQEKAWDRNEFLDFQSHYGDFAQAGADVLEYPGPSRNHSKAIVVDGETSFIGSFDFDRASEYLNHETMLEIDDPEFARRLADVIEMRAGVSSASVRAGAVLKDVGRSGCASAYEVLSRLRGFR